MEVPDVWADDEPEKDALIADEELCKIVDDSVYGTAGITVVSVLLGPTTITVYPEIDDEDAEALGVDEEL